MRDNKHMRQFTATPTVEELEAEIERLDNAIETMGSRQLILEATNERLRAALDKACEVVETKAQVGRSIDYASGFNRGVQCQRLRATFARDEALREDEK